MAKQFKNDFIRQGAASLRLALADFKSAYSGSVFGSLWAVAEPLVTVLVYWFVYTVAFGGQSVGETPFYLWLSVGIAPWFFISNGLVAVTSSYRDYAYLVKKTRFDKSQLPIIRTASALFSHLIFVALVLIIGLATGEANVSPPLLIASVCLSSLFVYSLGRILALICAAFKDMKNILSVLLSVGFWLTPIFWNAEVLPQKYAGLVYLNPAAIIAELYRLAILGYNIIGRNCFVLIFLCVILLLVGEIYEKKALPDIADRL